MRHTKFFVIAYGTGILSFIVKYKYRLTGGMPKTAAAKYALTHS
jgi:hypothetical protein